MHRALSSFIHSVTISAHVFFQLQDNESATPTKSEVQISVNTFLDSAVAYTLPPFTYNRMKNTIALTLHVKNVAPESIEMADSGSAVEMKFTSIGAGHFPIHHAFYFGIPADAGSISDARAEAWDNNVIIQLDLNGMQPFESYQAGLSRQDYNNYPCPFTEKGARASKEPAPACNGSSADDLVIEVASASPEEIQIEVTSKAAPAATPAPTKAKKHKKAKKNRSYSESHCDQLLADIQDEHTANKQAVQNASNLTAAGPCVHQTMRTISESSNDEQQQQHLCEPILKGILKRRSSYNCSVSECSSDDQANGKYSCSMDLGIGSFSSIPEERGGELSDSVRKTVTFDKNLCRKLLFK